MISIRSKLVFYLLTSYLTNIVHVIYIIIHLYKILHLIMLQFLHTVMYYFRCD